jgi:CheY-like chemotaxis protein
MGLASDGEEAIEIVRTNQPDAALVDLVMSRGGGLRAVRGRPSKLPSGARLQARANRRKRRTGVEPATSSLGNRRVTAVDASLRR